MKHFLKSPFSRTLPLLFLLFFLIPTSPQAQSLSFSQVKLITAQDTVPSGKTWKVESLVNTGNVIQNNILQIQIDGQTVTMVDCEGNGRCFYFTKLPLWLPEGTILNPIGQVAKISLIEFTVVP